MNATHANRPRSWSTIAAGLASLAALVGFAVGVPFALLRVRPHPLPERWPTISRVITMMKAGTVDSAVLPNVVAVLVWACWAGMILCVLAEIIGRSRGRTIHIPVISTGFGGLSRRWVGTIAAMIAMLLPQGVVSASPLSGRLAATSPGPRVIAAQSVGARSSLRQSAQSQDSSVDSASVFTPSNASTVSTSQTSSTSAQLSAPTSSFADQNSAVGGANDRVVVVQPGDSYWELADTLTGDGFKWRELLTANVGRTMPDGYLITEGDQMLHTGWELTVPASWGTSPAGGWHQRIVKRGDTLSKIAAAEYGSANAWHTIAADNPNVAQHPDLILPGEVLSIRDDISNRPDDAVADPLRSIEAPISADPPASPTDVSPAGVALSATIDPLAFPESSQALPEFQQLSNPRSDNDVPNNLSQNDDLPKTVAPTNDVGSDARSDGVPSLPLVGFLGVSAGLAAAVLWRLKRQRQQRHLVRLLLTPPAPLSALAHKAELSYRAVADETQLGWIDAALLLAQHRAKGTRSSVQIVCAQKGWIEIRLDHPVEATAPFEPNDRLSWKLSTAVDRDELAEPDMTFTSSPPFMLSTGDTPEGPVWIALDDIETLNVVCDDTGHGPTNTGQTNNADITNAVLASWAVQLLAVPWSQERSVVLVGAPDSIQQIAQGTHAECVPASSMINPQTWMTERATIVSFVGYDTELATMVSKQTGRIVVVTADNSIESSRVDTVTVRIDSSSLSGSVQPGDIELSAVSLAGPSQMEGIRGLIGITETVLDPSQATETGSKTPAAWDATATPVVSSTITSNWAREADTVEVIHLADPEPSVTVPIPTFDFAPVPSRSVEQVPETIDDVIARVMTRQPLELSLFAKRPDAVVDGMTPSRSVADLLMFLAVNGPVAHEDLIASVYPTRQVERAVGRQLVWRTRQFVGNVLTGGDKEIALDAAGYGLDWHRFVALTNIGHARLNHHEPDAASKCFEQALRLVRAMPWEANNDTKNGEGQWAVASGLIENVVASVTNAATALARLALDSGRPELAVWAAQHTLSAHPFPNVELVELGFEGAVHCGDHTAARNMRSLLMQARDDFDVVLSSRTVKMFDALDEPLKVGR